jgi:hypothetical protein
MKKTRTLPPCPVKQAHNTHTSPLPTWGQIKKLATEGKELLRHVSQPQTSEALFLAMVTILPCQVCGTSGHTSLILLFFILHHGMTPTSRFLPMILLYWGALSLPIFLINGLLQLFCRVIFSSSVFILE